MKLQEVITKAREARKGNHPEDIQFPGDVKPFPQEWENRFTYEELERLAVRTVDGLMTDEEALEAENLCLN